MKYFVILIILSFLVMGCTTQSPSVVTPSDTELINTSSNAEIITSTSSTSLLSTYNGNVLAGDKTPYIEFNTKDYQKAISDGKLIFLYFYSNDDSKSRFEETKLITAFNDMTSIRVIGFKVHYNDAVTTDVEKQLALELGIKDSDTKIILKNEKVVKRSTDSWSTNTYPQQIFSYLN